MPNFDAGHYFLTVLAPLRTDPMLVDGRSRSRRHLVKEVLAQLPTAERTVASQGSGRDNPFARCRRTHFARFAVLDDVVFNGRAAQDSIVRSIERVDPIVPQPVDSLTTPYLIFVGDFDAPDGSDFALSAITDDLWATMQDELVAIFQHCRAFDTKGGASGFFGYVKRCQIETTMPFNDYWSAPPSLPTFDLKPYFGGGLAAALLFVLGLFHGLHWFLGAAFAVLALDVALALRGVSAAGQKPFPTVPMHFPQPDLPTILKALHMQRAFTDFAIEAQTLRAQGGSDDALHDAFAAFLAAHKPLDLDTATQIPGVIGA